MGLTGSGEGEGRGERRWKSCGGGAMRLLRVASGADRTLGGRVSRGLLVPICGAYGMAVAVSDSGTIGYCISSIDIHNWIKTLTLEYMEMK